MSIEQQSSSNYEIIATQSLITFKDEPLYVKFKDNTTNESDPLTLIIKFSSDPSIDELKFNFTSPNDKTLELELINANSGLDTGNVSPIEIGASEDGRRYYLNLRSNKVGESWTVVYTIYHAKKS